MTKNLKLPGAAVGLILCCILILGDLNQGGMHHHCSENHIQGYSDEFHFRFNRRGFMDSILDKLLTRIVASPPLFITLREPNGYFYK